MSSSVLCDSACLPTQGGDGDKLHEGEEIRLLLELLETKVGKERKSKIGGKTIKHQCRNT